jgi:hypothetical protein
MSQVVGNPRFRYPKKGGPRVSNREPNHHVEVSESERVTATYEPTQYRVAGGGDPTAK